MSSLFQLTCLQISWILQFSTIHFHRFSNFRDSPATYNLFNFFEFGRDSVRFPLSVFVQHFFFSMLCCEFVLKSGCWDIDAAAEIKMPSEIEILTEYIHLPPSHLPSVLLHSPIPSLFLPLRIRSPIRWLNAFLKINETPFEGTY